jgi:RNA polymerase sigma factor (TIGR02999 family)
MSTSPEPELSRLFQASEAGNPAAKNELFAALYRELHRLAQHHLASAGGPLTLSATTLLHEAYLDITRRERLAFPERNSFLAYASRAMRGLMIDYIRTRRAQKRGGDLTLLSLEDEPPDIAAADVGMLGQLNIALEELETIDPALAQLVDLKFFCGFTFDELAAMRGVSERTVRRDWQKARLLLHRTLGSSP